jgi:hypothetical protein
LSRRVMVRSQMRTLALAVPAFLLVPLEVVPALATNTHRVSVLAARRKRRIHSYFNGFFGSSLVQLECAQFLRTTRLMKN